MSDAARGFVIRPPTPVEMPAILAQFPKAFIGHTSSVTLAAFAQPGNHSLGALCVRASARGKAGHFRLFVHPDYRRRGIGRQLVYSLYRFAVTSGAQGLVLAEPIHESEIAGAFCRAIGLVPQATLVTYVMDLQRDVLRIAEPIVRRFSGSHPHVIGTRILHLQQVEPLLVAEFVSQNYHGFHELTLHQATNGYFDAALSMAALHDGKIRSITLMRSQVIEPSIFLELTLSSPQFRNGPLPLIVGIQSCQQAVALGKTHLAYEADPTTHSFAINFANRCGARPGSTRFRYGIDRCGMRSRLSE